MYRDCRPRTAMSAKSLQGKPLLLAPRSEPEGSGPQSSFPVRVPGGVCRVAGSSGAGRSGGGTEGRRSDPWHETCALAGARDRGRGSLRDGERGRQHHADPPRGRSERVERPGTPESRPRLGVCGLLRANNRCQVPRVDAAVVALGAPDEARQKPGCERYVKESDTRI